MRPLTEREIRDCVHPDETPRFVLALVLVLVGLLVPAAMFIAWIVRPYLIYDVDRAVGTSITQILAILLYVGLFFLILWLFYLLLRGMLRTRAVLITSESLPEMHAAIRRVCAALSYPGARIEAYLASETSYAAERFQSLRSDLLVITAPVAEGMYQYGAPSELEFVVSSHVGAMRIRFIRSWFMAEASVMAGRVPLIGLFVRPYLRATVYSADRLGLMVTRNLQSAVDTIGIGMVGKDLTSLVAIGGWIRQHQMNRWSVISFLLRLNSNEPHPIDRIANVLCFGRAMLPEQYDQMIGRLPPDKRRELEAILDNSRHVVWT